MAIDWDAFHGTTTFILGAGKGAGKTTFLKYAVANLRRAGRVPGYLTVGIDGERRDHLSGAPKPTVTAEAGDVIATTESALAASDGSFGILEVFEEPTRFGRPVVARVLRGGNVELIGPGRNRRVGEVVAFVHEHTAADAVLVDGAADRGTQASCAGPAGWVLVAMATPATLARVADRIRLIDLLADLPTGDGVPSEAMAVTGALTSDRLASIPAQCPAVVLDDCTKVFVGFAPMSKLVRGCRVGFARRFDPRFVVVNLRDVSGDDLARAVGGAAMRRVVVNPFMERAA